MLSQKNWNTFLHFHVQESNPAPLQSSTLVNRPQTPNPIVNWKAEQNIVQSATCISISRILPCCKLQQNTVHLCAP